MFHQSLINDSYKCKMKLPDDGIILGFEKVQKSKLSSSGNFNLKKYLSNIGMSNFRDRLTEVFAKKNAKFLDSKVLAGSKKMVLTHWFEIINGTPQKKFDAYYDLNRTNYDLIGEMKVQLDLVAKDVVFKLKSGNYSHLVVGCTGWNNDQEDAMFTYNSWLKYTREASEVDGVDFKPFFVGITWPSFWGDKRFFFSIWNKANDADELGIFTLNNFFWNGVVAEMDKQKIRVPIIFIGHSLGARVLADLAFSRFLLGDGVNRERKINLMINFQGAYPINRFLEKGSFLRGFYNHSAGVKKMVATTSYLDRAMNAGFYTNLIGNETSFKRIKDKNLGDRFDIITIGADGLTHTGFGESTYVIANSSDFISAKPNDKAGLFSGSHGDVKDQEAGNFIWQWIKMFSE